MDIRPYLLAALTEMNLQISDKAYERFNKYAQLLADYNEKVNLTAITDERGIAEKHFADSLSLLRYADIPDGARLLDVGTGAGFPGLALMCVREDIRAVLIDGTGKKLDFVRLAAKELGLNPTVIHIRAEEAGRDLSLRESFDIVTARAVADLRVLCEYCLPFVKPGGAFLAMKGGACGDELEDAAHAIDVLGGKAERIDTFSLGSNGERSIITVRKISQTPPKHPRASTQISKKPL